MTPNLMRVLLFVERSSISFTEQKPSEKGVRECVSIGVSLVQTRESTRPQWIQRND